MTESTTSENNVSRRMTMPQDIRYATESSDREKLMEKFNNYQMSDVNACFIRFLIDRRQKKILFGSNEDKEQENLQILAKKFDVNLSTGYQQPPKHSFKLFGTEQNVRQCLIELLNRIFKRNSSNEEEEAAVATTFVTTINPDASVTEETKVVEGEEVKYVPLERKPEYTFNLLITSQGQEVLKKNWSFFGGSLQQRLNIVVANPVRLTKFGDKQNLCELSITGESIENLVDASLQIVAFINDVLGVATQPYKSTSTNGEDNIEHSSRRPATRHHQRQSAPPSSTSTSNYSDRTFFNRNRNDIVEENVLIRNDCIARIVGKRGANLRLIKNKSHLIDLNIEREADENGYVHCHLTANQSRNIQTAIETIRNFLHTEDSNAVIVGESVDRSIVAPFAGFSTKSFQIDSSSNVSQPTHNFQNRPSFDFTHQATSAARKTDKRPGDLTENSPQIETKVLSSKTTTLSPQHRTKRTCPETKEINCSTDEGFWIQKQFYQALDDESKQIFDSLIDKLDKIRLASEENAARKHQRLAGRNRSNKTRAYSSSISQLNEENSSVEKRLPVKSISNEAIATKTPSNEEKENHQESTPVIVQEN